MHIHVHTYIFTQYTHVHVYTHALYIYIYIWKSKFIFLNSIINDHDKFRRGAGAMLSGHSTFKPSFLQTCFLIKKWDGWMVICHVLQWQPPLLIASCRGCVLCHPQPSPSPSCDRKPSGVGGHMGLCSELFVLCEGVLSDWWVLFCELFLKSVCPFVPFNGDSFTTTGSLPSWKYNMSPCFWQRSGWPL